MKNTNYINIIQQGETQTVELKTSFGKEVLESVCAFSNTKGGCIFIGVSDSGEITGVELGKESVQNIQNKVKQAIQPSVIPDISTIDIDGDTVLLIKVDEFPIKPVSIKGRFYKRVNNSNHIMDVNEISNLYLKTFTLSWDSYPYPSYQVNQIDEAKVLSFIEKVNKEERFNLPNNTN